MDRSDAVAFFEERTRQTVRFAMAMQYDDLDTCAFSRPELARCGVRYALNELKLRIDSTYHAQSAMLQWYETALQDPGLPAALR